MRNKVAKFLQRVTTTTGEYRRAKKFWNKVPHTEKPGFKEALKKAHWIREKERSATVWVDEAAEISAEAWEKL